MPQGAIGLILLDTPPPQDKIMWCKRWGEKMILEKWFRKEWISPTRTWFFILSECISLSALTLIASISINTQIITSSIFYQTFIYIWKTRTGGSFQLDEQRFSSNFRMKFQRGQLQSSIHFWDLDQNKFEYQSDISPEVIYLRDLAKNTFFVVS